MKADARPLIFGIVNVTIDSFSDGGKFISPKDATARASMLLTSGADVLDLGAAASNPDAQPVLPAEEISRLTPLIASIPNRQKISIDSFAVETQRWALSQGVGWLNDIQGFPNPEIYSDLAQSDTKLIIMHNIATRGSAQRLNTSPSKIFDLLFRFFDKRIEDLTSAGIGRGRLVIDPGMGYFLGTDPQVSMTVLRELERLNDRYKLPVLVSVSRKSFVRKLANVEIADSGPATLAAELYATLNGATFIRTHDVTALKQALDVWIPLHTNN